VPELVVQLGSEVDGLTLHQIPEQETKKSFSNENKV
jgi:hypothetical protein